MAAGRSSRFGSTKQLIEISGEPMVRRAAALARDVCGERVITVIGHDCGKVLDALGSDAGFVVVNDDYHRGLSGSIARGVRACAKDADAILLHLADQPLVTTVHLQALVDAWSGGDDEIVATAFDDTQGPPVLFPRGAFDDLQVLTGDNGARALLRDSRFNVRTVRFEPAALDIDEPGDLATLG